MNKTSATYHINEFNHLAVSLIFIFILQLFMTFWFRPLNQRSLHFRNNLLACLFAASSKLATQLKIGTRT